MASQRSYSSVIRESSIDEMRSRTTNYQSDKIFLLLYNTTGMRHNKITRTSMNIIENAV